MSITRKLMLAGAVAISACVAMPGRSPAVGSAPVAASVAPAQLPAPEQAAQSVRLNAMEMEAVRGGGFWKKVWKVVKKIIKWILNNPPPPPGCQTLPCPVEEPPVISEESVFDANLAEDVIDTFENEVTVNEYYDDDTAFHEGRMSSSSQNESGFVFISRTGGGGGGGGGDTCIDRTSCEQPYMY